jgi:DNA-binding IclR family transcriptional regulator
MESLPTESPAPALERGIAILNILNSGESYSLETISKKLKLPRSSLLRLLSTLQRCGWIQRKRRQTLPHINNNSAYRLQTEY